MSAPTIQQLVARNATREQIEDWCRARTQHYPVLLRDGGIKIVCRVLGKYLMTVLARDYALAPHLVLDGIWEPWITMAIARHVNPGMRCMDVGACYGYYSLLMADIVGPEGKVEAWEPVWSNFIRRNADFNGLPIHVQALAMGTDTQSEFRFTLPEAMFNAGDVRLVKVTEKTGAWTRRTTMGIPDPLPWDFIKIDVEGAEADVWQALAGVRQNSPNLTVCMEFTPSKHQQPYLFLRALCDDGFVLGTVGHDGWPRPCTVEEALVPDTGDFRMLWLTRAA